MGNYISKKCKDPFGFGNTEIKEKFAKFEAIADLKGLKVAVTGSNSGLGFATAKRLAENGASVIMICRDLNRAEEARNKMKGDVTIQSVDMTSFKSISGYRCLLSMC